MPYFLIGLGILSALIAKKQKRNPFLWFIIGVLCPIAAFFFLFLLPPNIDRSSTKDIKEQREEEGVIDITPSSPFEKIKKDFTFWYYLEKGEKQRGPMSFDAFKQAWKEGKVTSNTYVWNESLSGWTLFRELE